MNKYVVLNVESTVVKILLFFLVVGSFLLNISFGLLMYEVKNMKEQVEVMMELNNDRAKIVLQMGKSQNSILEAIGEKIDGEVPKRRGK